MKRGKGGTRGAEEQRLFESPDISSANFVPLCPAILLFGSGKMTRPVTLPFRISLLFRCTLVNERAESKGRYRVDRNYQTLGKSARSFERRSEIARNTPTPRINKSLYEIRAKTVAALNVSVSLIFMENRPQRGCFEWSPVFPPFVPIDL